MSLQGKVVLVTGGGRDIGRACALELAKQGAHIVITYLSSAETANSAVNTFGSIDHLVHVTGGLIDRVKIADMSMLHWNQVMDVNLTSLFMTCRAVIPHLSKGSAIVALASQAGRDGGGPGAVAYATSKGAVMSFVRGLAKELGPDIRVNSVCPGMINTGFHDTFTNDQVRSNVANATCIKREGASEEVANLVSFLTSDKASYMTGNNVDINGGLIFS